MENRGPIALSESERSQLRARLLADAAHVLGGSLDVETTFAEVARLCMPVFSDVCAFELVREDGTHVRIPFAAAETVTGEQSVVRPLGEALRSAPPSASHLSVALEVAGARAGALTLTQGPSLRAFDEADRAFAVELAKRAANALENARRFSAERAARGSAERLATRLEKLHTVATELATALSRERIADVVIESGVSAIGAATGAIYLLEPSGQVATLFRAFGFSEDALARFSISPLGAPTPLAEALRTRTAVFLGTREDYAARFPSSEARTRDVSTHVTALACLPILVEGTCIGAIALGFEGPHPFPDDERPFLELLAHHCGGAFARERMLDAERRYLARIELLSQASELFSASLDYERTLRTVVKISVPALGDLAFLDVVEPQGEVRRLVHASDEQTKRLAERLPSARESAVIALDADAVSFHPDTAGAEALADFRALGVTSVVSVPLASQGESLGALTLCHLRGARAHDAQDVQLAVELAHRAAQAVRHTRLYAEAEAAIRRAEEAAARAEEASRLKDEFLATISHELRTPLSAILGWSAVLKRTEGTSLPATFEKGIEVIARNARMQHRLVEDLLDVSRIVRGELRIETVPVDLTALVREVIENVRPSAQARGIEVALTADESCTMAGDPDRLRQVLWNLLANAVKFSHPEGVVEVSLRLTDGRLVLEVRDHGAGIDEDFLPHVFERFRQADGSSTRAHGGLGLGLAIVRHLTEMHGGTVTAKSAGKGRGTTFTVTLPVRAILPLPAEAPTRPHRAGPDGPLAGMRVLVVEDDHDARDLIEIVLRRHGAIVEGASTSEQALMSFARFSPEVVVSDIGMPEHDGYWLLDALRKRAPELPILALTAYARPEDKERARHAAFDHYLAKPVDAERLVGILAQYVDRSQRR